MELVLFCILALVAGSQAGPIQDRGDQCAQQCTVSNQFNYEEGKVYNFLYENTIRTAIQGASEDHAGLQLTANVALTFASKCEAILQLSDARLAEYDPETLTMKPVISNLADRLTRHSVRVSFQDGKIEHLCLTDSSEEPEIVNIKKGILSVIQNSMDDISKSQTVPESDVSGECQAEYTSADKGWYNVRVTKSKNLLGCTGRHSAQSAIQGIPYTSQSKIQSVPLVKSTHNCEQELVKSTGRLVSAMCEEKHVFAPFSRQESGAVTHSKQTLTFRNEGRARTDLAPVHSRVTLKYDHDDAKSTATSIDRLQQHMKEICEATKNGMTTETPGLFRSLVYIMKTMDAPSMIDVFQKIKKAEFCLGNSDRVKTIFLDAIPMTGTAASLRLMSQMLIGKEVSGIEADMWLTSLSFIQNPSVDMLAEVKPLLSLKTNEEKAMLSVSSLVHSLCRNNPSCDNYLEVKKIISLMERKIASGCIVNEPDMKTSLIAIRAIGNAGFGTSAIPTMTKCFTRSKNPIEIRLSAVEAFQRMPCKIDRSPLLNILTNAEEDSEMRIAAYKSLMACPSDYLLRQVKTILSKEEVNQVGSYIWSHLTNLMETSDPHKQGIKSILDDSILQKEFDMDKRKFSRNYEGSLFVEKINTGATVDADIIWSSKSFIPRSGMLNLTVDLFGNAVNLFEVGGRMEGLEYFMESYFGPNGYFSDNDVQNAAEETALAPIRADKVKKINGRMSKVMDEIRGSMYLRVFGNELRYMNFKGIDSLLSSEDFNIFDVLMKLSKDNKYQFTHSSMFLDSHYIIPTSSGFPLTLSVNGTATIDLQASGKMDVLKLTSKPASLDINGIIKPSGTVQIASLMTVGVATSKIGVKMVSSLHTSTSVQGKVSVSEGSILDAQFDLPEKQMDIVSVQSSFFTLHRDSEREQKMITSNKQSSKVCTGATLAKVSGLELCSELEYPNASLVADAPYFPITGPVRLGLYLNKVDTLTAYRLRARSTHTKDNNIVHLSFSTPDSQIDRHFGIDFNLNKNAGTIDSSITSPWKKGDFKGIFTNNRKLKTISGSLNWDGTLRYEVKAKLASEKSGPGMLYTPSLTVTVPGRKSIELKGSIKAAAWKLLDIDLSFVGLTHSPIVVKTTLQNKGDLMRASASVQLEPKKEYLFETSMQTLTLKKKVSYRPQISIRTPTDELIAFGGSLDKILGRGYQYNFVLDKVSSKPLILKGGVTQRQYRRGRVLYNVKVDLRTPLVDTQMRTKLDNRNFKTIASDIDMKYVIRKVARDSVKLVTKVNNLSSKSLTKLKGSIFYTSKKNPTTNFKISSNLNHNKKHSEVDADLSYGSDPKDVNKQVSVKASLDRQIMSWSAASVTFIGEYKKGNELRLFSRVKHSHDPKSIESNVVLRKNKEAITGDLLVKDESKDLQKLSGKLNMYVLGKSITLSQLLEESKPRDYTSTLLTAFGKSKSSIITTWKQTADGTTVLKSDVSLSGFEPLLIESEYNLGPSMYKTVGSIKKGNTQYSIATTSEIKAGRSVQTSVDIIFPSRHIISNVEGSYASGKYNIRADTRWNADRDDTQRLTVRGSGQMSGLHQLDGSLTIQYPSRTIAMNIKQSTVGKYVSHVDFQWEPKKQISIDSSLGTYEKNDKKEVEGSFNLKTPFSTLKTVDVSVNHVTDSSQFKTNVDVEWNPKRILSTTFILKRPTGFDSFDAEIIGKTPFSNFKTVKVSHSHKNKDVFTSLTKIAWNKQAIQMDMSLANKGNERKTDVVAEVGIKSSFKPMATVSGHLSYLLNGKKMETKAILKRNKKNYNIQSLINHGGYDWKINSGEIVLETPSNNIKTTWNHRLGEKDLSSTTEMVWGNNQRIFVKLDGLKDFSANTDLTSAIEIQTPFSNLKDVILQFKHQSKPGLIDSSISLMKEGSKLASAEGKYLRKNGNVNSYITFTNPLRDGDVSVKINSNYLQSPFSLDLNVLLSPAHSLALVSSLKRNEGGNVYGSAILQSSLIEPVKITVTRDVKASEIDSVVSLEYSPEKVLKIESQYRFGSNKFVKMVVTSPFTDACSAEMSMSSIDSVLTMSSSIEALPLIPKWSADAHLDRSSGIMGKVRINTPLTMVPYSQLTFSSGSSLRKNQIEITAEYAPGKIINLLSRYNVENIKSLSVLSTLSSPFESLPYASVSFNHQGTLSNMRTTGDVEYIKGKHIIVEHEFSSLAGLRGSLSMRSPFAREMKGSFDISNNDQNLKASTEIVFGKRIFAELTHSGTSDNFSSDLRIEVDSDKWHGLVSFEAAPFVKTSLTLQTPLKRFQSIKAMHSFDGTLHKFTNKLDISTSEFGSFSASTDFDSTTAISANIAITTPFKGYRKIIGMLKHQGHYERFQTQAEVSIGTSKVAGNIKLVTMPSIDLEMSLETPFSDYKHMAIFFNQEGDSTSFKTNVKLEKNKKTSEIVLNYNYVKKLDIDLTIRHLNYDPIKATIDVAGNRKRFSKKIQVSFGKNKYNSDVRFQQKPFTAFVDIRTPIQWLKRQRLNIKHAGTLQAFKCNVNYNCNGKKYEGDASYTHGNTVKGDVAFNGPNLPKIGARVTHGGSIRNFKSEIELSYGKKVVKATGEVNSLDGVRGSLEIETPFTGIRNIRSSLAHSGTTLNFKTTGDLSFNKKQGRFDLAFDATNGLNADLQIATPFDHFEKMAASVKHVGDLSGFSTESTLALNENTIAGKMNFENEMAVSGSVSLISSIRSIGNYEGSFRHERNENKWRTHAEVSVDSKQSQLDSSFDATNGYEGSLSIKSPIVGNREFGFTYTPESSSLKANMFASIEGRKAYNILADASNEAGMNFLLSIDTPLSGFEFTELTISLQRSQETVRSQATINFRGQSHSIDTSFTNSPDIQGRLSLKTPAFDNVDSTFSYTGHQTNFRSSFETLRAGKNMIRIDLMFNIDGKVDTELKMSSSYFKNVKVAVNQRQSDDDMESRVVLDLEGYDASGALNIRIRPTISGTLSLYTPFTNDLNVQVEHNGPILNSKSSFDITYGGQSQLSVNTALNTERNINTLEINTQGQLNVKTPAFDSFDGTFSYSGHPKNFKSSFEALLAGKNMLRTDIIFNIDDKVNTQLKLSSPFFRNVKVEVSEKKSNDDLSVRALLNVGGEITSGEVYVKLRPMITASLNIATPVTKDLSVQLEHNGLVSNCRSSLGITYGGQSQVNVNTALNTEQSINGNINFESRIPGLRKATASVNHVSDETGLRSSFEITKDGKSASTNVQYKNDEVSFLLTSPYNDDVKLSYVKKGSYPHASAKAEASYGSNTLVQVDAKLNSPTDGELSIKTPVKGYELSLFKLQHSQQTDGITTHGEMTILGTKHAVDISLNQNSGRISLLSPLIKPITIATRGMGNFLNFDTHGEVNYGNSKYEIDVTLNVESRKEGQLSIKYPGHSSEISFDIIGNINQFSGIAKLDSNGMVHSLEMNFDSIDKLDGSVSLKSPSVPKVGGSISLNGDWNDFIAKAEVTINSDIHEIEAALKSKGKFEATMSLKSPWVVPLRIDLQLDQTASKFESIAKMSIDEAVYRSEVTGQFQNGLEVGMTIATPNAAPLKLSISMSDRKVIASASYGKSMFFNTQVGLKHNPLRGNVVFESSLPGYERIDARFTHKVQDLSFHSHAEVAIGEDKSEADVHLNFGSKFEGGLSLSSPYLPSVKSGFEFKGNSEKFSSHIESSYGEDKYAVDASLDTTSYLDALITLSSPIEGYKTVEGKLSSIGVFPNIDSNLNIKTDRRSLLSTGAKVSLERDMSAKFVMSSFLTPTYELDVEHKGSVNDFVSTITFNKNGKPSRLNAVFKSMPHLEISLQLSTPWTEALSTSLSFENQLHTITTHVEAAIGTRRYTTDISVLSGNNIATTLAISTPLVGYENIKGSAKHSTRKHGFKSSVAFETNSRTIVSLESDGSWTGPISGNLKLQTPYPGFEQVTASGLIEGTLPNVKCDFKFANGDMKYSAVAELEQMTSTNGRIAIVTPIPGFKEVGASFYKKGSMSNIDVQANVNYEGERVSVQFKNKLGQSSLDTEVELQTPYTEDATFKLSYQGIPTDFSNTLTFVMGNNMITSVTTFNLARSNMNVETRLSTVFEGYKDDQSASLSYKGGRRNIQATGSARILGKDYSADTSVILDSKVKVRASLKTPVPALRDVAISFDFNKEGGKYEATSELQIDTDRKLEAHAEFLKYGWRRLQSTIALKTPFPGWEQSQATYRHIASVDSFECDTEMTVFGENYKGKLMGSLSPLSMSLSANTPFRVLSQIDIDARADYSTNVIKSDINMDVSGRNIVSAKIDVDFSMNPKTALFTLTTPFDGFENTAVRFSMSGNIRDFRSEFHMNTPFNAPIKVSSNLQYQSASDITGSISFKSQIRGLEEVQLNAKNSFSYNTYNSQIEASWSPTEKIVLQSILKDSRNTMSGDIMLTTPFKLVNQLNIKSEMAAARNEYTSSFATTYNGHKCADVSVKVGLGSTKTASVTMRSPVTFMIDLNGSNMGEVYEGAAVFSSDIDEGNNAFTIDGTIDIGKKQISIKHKCPMMAIEFDGTFTKQSSKMDFNLNNVRYGYDMKLSDTTSNVKVVLPSRSLQLSGSSVGRTTEASFMWDADKDETRKVAVRSVITPTRDSLKADMALLLPSIGKDAQIESAVIVNRGRILFDGKTELTYSRDSRKKITLVSRLEDISTDRSSKNYSFVLGISHPFTSVDVKVSSHMGKSSDKMTGGFNMEYLTVRRETKTFSVNGEVDKLRKSASIDIASPVKKISIVGSARDQPFRLSVRNSYDNKAPLSTNLSFDTDRRLINFETNYDLENPSSEFHFTAKYVNSTAVAAEIFRVVNRLRITDALVTSRLNNSRLLHSRLHWRPSALQELKNFVSRKTATSINRLSGAEVEIVADVSEELRQKKAVVSQEFIEELMPLVEATAVMYERNDYHVRDVVDAFVRAMECVRAKMEQAKNTARDLTMPLTGKISEGLKATSQTFENAFTDMDFEYLYYIRDSGLTFNGHIYNMTRHPAVTSLGERYAEYLNYMRQMRLSPSYNMADRYTSAIYGAREMINPTVMQQTENAYKYWEVKENAQAVIDAIIEWVKEEVERELSDVQATLINIAKPEVTVYDPENGEIQTEVHLPLPVESLDTIPSVDVTPFVNKARQYIPEAPRVALPSVDMSNLLPPFNAVARLQGNTITTFDGTVYELTDSCTQVLARDFVNGNFSLVVNKIDNNNKSLVIFVDGVAVEILQSGQVKVNDKSIDGSLKLNDIVITIGDHEVSVDGANSIKVTYSPIDNVYTFIMNGWYFGKTAGLLGTYDNEPSNDFMSSFGKPINNSARFTRTWDIGTSRCR